MLPAFSVSRGRKYIPWTPSSQHQPHRGKRKITLGCLGRGGRGFRLTLLKERKATMEILTHIIFVLNLLKSLLNHFF